MAESRQTSGRSHGWMGLRRGHQARPLEWLGEKAILGVSLSAILMVFLIFLFVARESLPVLLGLADSGVYHEPVSLEEMARMPRGELADYLDLSAAEMERMDEATLKLLMEVKAEEIAAAPEDKDARINTVSWPYLLLPHQWTGYDKPEFIWQPVSAIHKYNVVPLFIGSLKATLVALLFAVPLSLAAAIYVSQLAAPRTRELLKPAIEMLAGIPSVVLGFFALIVLATVLQNTFGYQSRLNALVAGIALGFAIIPVVFSIAEDALTSVPRSYTQAALALGASKWQAAWKVVLPAAIPGVFAAVVLGFGRAIGETMIVLMASGNASIVSWNILDSTRTITATIAAELAETVVGGHHYRMLFLLGTLLFAVTFASNLVADLIIHRLKARLEGKA
ncbi:MAG: phosphate ABC transporter permease subunit PstC [Verrucomicrobia bacterium]|jgi:phosphate transport system permease protein|nr:phosphate ABC transporter permease subunit PstC [Verrucomicrobiota bacterium]